MAVTSLCGRLLSGQDAACNPPVRKYYQQAVLINKSDIAEFTITKTDPEAAEPTCAYNVAFTLDEGATGYRFIGPENGSSYFGSYDKTTSDLGFAAYTHHANILVTGIDEAAKCILDALDKGSFIAAFQLLDGTVEIYGMESGLSTGDYTYDVQTGGGGTLIVLNSQETAPENSVPLVYVSETPGQETADFDDAFSNIPPSV